MGLCKSRVGSVASYCRLSFERRPLPFSGLTLLLFQLYHEAAAVGLLETVLFHEDGAQCISEVAVDLLDYAVEQLTALMPLIKYA